MTLETHDWPRLALHPQHFPSRLRGPWQGHRTVTGPPSTFGVGASARLLLGGRCSNAPSQLQHLFYKSPVLSDTIWNDICHPLSGVIYLLALQRNIWCALISSVQANIHRIQLREITLLDVLSGLT